MGDFEESIDKIAAILPLIRSLRNVALSFSSRIVTIREDMSARIKPLVLSAGFFKPTVTVVPPPPINPNTRIKTSGKPRLKITAEGLRNMARRLAFVIASMALN